MNERDLFIAAVQLDDEVERAAFLDKTCAADSVLRQRVEALMDAFGQAGSFLQPPANGIVGAGISPLLESVGTQIGPYKLLEQIGSGGMGAVYRAEQKTPLRRMVALKVIKPGMDTQQVLTRFEAERQALALMNHPNIARVLDGGATDTGRPYFVMELVKGVPVTTFCDRQKLKTRDRLQLFVKVCHAIQHAHQKGLIHRDIKPSNVLVEVHDVTAVPKVIDFGVAKAIGQQLTETTLHTAFGEMVGTPAYMSPEQAGESSIDIDTRSDVYSLGVLLYEILTGYTPFERKSLGNADFNEMRRVICEVDPLRPSARVGTLEAKARSTVSDCRQTDPCTLSRQLRGELDWIVMKTLEKDRNRRYQSATALAADVQRYLDDEPVVACPPSATYRLRKTLSRHRGVFVVAMCVVASLLLGTGVSLWQAQEARSARQQANDYLKTAEAEKVRFQGLAWKSGIREAYSAWERRQCAEVDEMLQGLKESDPQAALRPEWQMLHQELNRSYRKLLQIAAPLHEVRIIPDSTLVVAAGGDGNLYIVDLQSSKLVRTISTSVASLHALAVSTDGRLLATGGVTDPVSDRATPLIYDLQTGERLHELPGQRTTIESLEFSADAKWLACGARYENVQVIDIETKSVTELPANRRNLWLSRSADGRQLAAQHYTHSIWKADFFPPFTGHLIATVHKPIKSMWDSRTNLLYSILGGTESLHLFNVSDEKNVCDLMGAGYAECFQLSDDSSLLVAGLISGEIVSWPVGLVLSPEMGADGRESGLNDGFTKWGSEIFPRIDMNGRWQVSSSPITSIAVSDDWIVVSAFGGELLAMPRPIGNAGDLRSIESAEQLAETSVTWSPDGHFVVAGRRDGTVCRGELLASSQLPVRTSSPSAAGSFDSKTGPGSEVVGLWKTLSPPNTGHVTAVAISPDQKLVAWVRHQNGVMLLRENSETILSSYGGAPLPGTAESPHIEVMEFSPDSRKLAWTGSDELHVVDVVSRDAVIQTFSLAGHGTCAAWSADGNTILVGGEFDNVVVLNLKTGTVQKIADCGNDAGAIQFSHDQQRIISGHDDGAVRLWTRAGVLIKTVHLHPTMVRSIALSHDGRIGVSADALGNFAVWLAETGEQIGVLITDSSLRGTSGNLLSETVFSGHDSQCHLLFENAEHQLILRTWNLNPTDPK